ncbi:MAG: ROK family transcriptional regulator [Candidatus Omnitrophota bacterium]|nr:ROK family transcriptional regulator [Candidatus Omnitrophota bacterium]MBU1929392.1 ROK family transcriptional regulator [Candidatus Omnitrophota bacterium]MBU2034868.1 ROK family transcriptional regulator [Candidatus Omnitrophota bacterium]MBU2257603.1 ROK family transcriptional regulator [Candidatus Omnitrophota bacterium]
MHELNFQKEDFSEKERRNIDILEILRRRGPISRPDISKEIGINVVTISNYIDDFIRHNFVHEKELDRSEGGRRPTLLDLNPQGGYVIGVGLNLMNMVGLLVDLKGNIITKTQIARPRASVNEIAECLLELIREILRRSKEYAADIKGIGVGMAGLINKEDGSIHWPQKMDHYYTYASVDLSLRELIEREFNLPTLIENDATSACFGEHWFNMDSDVKDIIYMFSGVGCGIMINGQIYRGAKGYAGEVSIYNYKEQDLFSCSSGNPCFIKRWEMDLGIVGQAKEMLAKDKEAAERFFKLTSSNIDNVDLKSVFIALRSKNEIAISTLDSAAKRLGIKIASLVNMLNPQIVVIGGGLEDAGEDFLNKVTLSVKDWSFREVTEDLKIVYSQLRENAVALGAAGLVMQRVFAQME